MISFESGPRLDAPRGDTVTQAVAALRGYGYQLYASGLAWMNLTDGEGLHLEVAEDYAVVHPRSSRILVGRRLDADPFTKLQAPALSG